MSGDKSVAMASKEHSAQTAGDTPDAALSLFGNDVDLGEDAGKTAVQKAEDARLMAIVGRKLRRARKAAGLSESAAGIALAQKGVTMISLYENGHRFPTLPNMRAFAELYGVTLDYLFDMHDDILRMPEEGNQAVLRGIISTSIIADFTQFTNALASRNAIMIEALSVDRVLLSDVAALAVDLDSTLQVIKKHAPDFEGIRGGAKLARLVGELSGSMSNQIKRRKQEEALAEFEAYYPAPETIKQQVQQLLLV